MRLPCPNCEAPLADVSGAGVRDVACPTCAAAARIVTADGYPAEFLRRTGDGSVLPAGQRRGGEDPLLSAGEAPLVSAIYARAAIRSGSPASACASGRLLRVVDHQSGNVVDTAAASSDPPTLAIVLALGVALTVFLLVLGTLQQLAAAILGSAFAGVLTFLAARRSLSRTQELEAGEDRRLMHERALREQQAGITGEMDRIVAEVAERTAFRDRLEGLRSRMQEVGGELYGTRLERLAGAIATLDQQLDVDRRLIAEYERVRKIVGIELETTEIEAAAMDRDFQPVRELGGELERLRERRLELETALQANEEVERLLRGP